MDNQMTPPKQHASRIKITVAVLAVAAICAALFLYFRQPAGPAGSTRTEVLAIVPFSGIGASHGQYVRDGFQMFEKDHPDSRIAVTIADSESSPPKAISAFEQQILRSKPRAVISVLSGVSDTLAPAAERNAILLIGVNTATDTFVKNYSWTQRINDRPVNHTAPLARVAARKFHRVAVMYSNDSFGIFCRDTFQSAFRELNSNELTLEPFASADRNQRPGVQHLLSKRPEAVFVAGYGDGYLSIFNALRTLKFTGPIFADINFSNPNVLKALGDAAEGVTFAAMDFNVDPPSTPKGTAFLEAYRTRFNREPWLGSAFAYDALSIMDHLDRTKQALNRQSIFALREWPGIAAPLSFPSPGECQYVFQFVRRTSGKNVLVDLEKLIP